MSMRIVNWEYGQGHPSLAIKYGLMMRELRDIVEVIRKASRLAAKP